MAEFQVVGKSKRRRGRSSKGIRPNIELCNSFSDNVDLNNFQSIESLVDKIDSCRNEIQQSQFFSDVKGLFTDGHHNELGEFKLKAVDKGDFKDIVCYGVGRLHLCPTARYQFALMLLLKDLLQITGLCYIYEPCFSQQDKDVVTQFGCTLIAENEEGKRTVHQKTLFFMLHCGKPLYNNLLWSNWEPRHLTNMMILGNSFSSYLERLPMRRLREEAVYIALVLPHVVEVPLPNTFRYLDIFNDSSFHYFPSNSLQDLPVETWRYRPEPHYEENDPEIIQVSRNTATKH